MKTMRGDGGQALIEIAVTLPVFLLLLFGTFTSAILLFGWCNITYASRVAARYASIHSNTSLVPATTTTISSTVSPYLIAAITGTTSTAVVYTPSNTIGSTVKVTVAATYRLIMPSTPYTAFTVSSTAQRTITR